MDHFGTEDNFADKLPVFESDAIFLSYASEDREAVLRPKEKLEEFKSRHWQQFADGIPNDDYMALTVERIKELRRQRRRTE